jgi:type I restriction enzyme S subunit
MIGEGRTRGQAAILDIDACNNQNCAAIWVSESPISPEFVYHWLCSQYEENRRRGAGNNQPALNKGRVQALPLPVPPLAEQEEIVDEVERRLSVIDEIEKQVNAGLKRAERLRQAILKKAFEGRLVPQYPDDEPAEDVLERIEAQS